MAWQEKIVSPLCTWNETFSYTVLLFTNWMYSIKSPSYLLLSHVEVRLIDIRFSISFPLFFFSIFIVCVYFILEIHVSLSCKIVGKYIKYFLLNYSQKVQRLFDFLLWIIYLILENAEIPYKKIKFLINHTGTWYKILCTRKFFFFSLFY